MSRYWGLWAGKAREPLPGASGCISRHVVLGMGVPKKIPNNTNRLKVVCLTESIESGTVKSSRRSSTYATVAGKRIIQGHANTCAIWFDDDCSSLSSIFVQLSNTVNHLFTVRPTPVFRVIMRAAKCGQEQFLCLICPQTYSPRRE